MSDFELYKYKPEAYEKLLPKFEERVDKTPGLGPDGSCWEWTGTTRKYKGKPYGGQFHVGSKRYTGAHRFSYLAEHGPFPRSSDIKHGCGNKMCVRPSHLEIMHVNRHQDGSLGRRFWSKVDKQGEHGPGGNCWLWTGNKLPRGYGTFALETSEREYAHRVSYQMICGEIADGLFVCHQCDVPSCVNPAHLFAAKPKGNTHDMLKKERHGGILTADQVKEIVALVEKGNASYREIGKRFGVTKTNISSIANGHSWSWLTGIGK